MTGSETHHVLDRGAQELAVASRSARVVGGVAGGRAQAAVGGEGRLLVQLHQRSIVGSGSGRVALWESRIVFPLLLPQTAPRFGRSRAAVREHNLQDGLLVDGFWRHEDGDELEPGKTDVPPTHTHTLLAPRRKPPSPCNILRRFLSLLESSESRRWELM